MNNKVSFFSKIKKRLSNLKNYHNGEFIPWSKQYFTNKMNKAYSKIIFSKEDIFISDEARIRFNSLIGRIPVIEELIEVRKQAKSYDQLVLLSYVIFDEYHKKLKEANIQYYLNSYNQKDTLFAENVVNDYRNRFYTNIDNIFLLIEKNYSIELTNKNSLLNPIIKNKDEVFDCLKEKGILDNNKKWKLNRTSGKKKYISILICKLKSLNLIEYSNYKVFHFKFEKLIGVEFDYNRATSTIDSFNNNLFLDDNSEKYFNNLVFLNKFKNKEKQF